MSRTRNPAASAVSLLQPTFISSSPPLAHLFQTLIRGSAHITRLLLPAPPLYPSRIRGTMNFKRMKRKQSYVKNIPNSLSFYGVLSIFLALHGKSTPPRLSSWQPFPICSLATWLSTREKAKFSLEKWRSLLPAIPKLL